MAAGIMTYMITDSILSSLIVANLPDIYRPDEFGGTFEQVKPHLMASYYKTLDEIAKRIHEKIRQDLLEVIAQLSHPIPEERGNPVNIRATVSKYSLHRYISIIDRLAKTMEYSKL